MSEIKVFFVLPDNTLAETDASETMLEAYESCKQVVNNISWVKETDLRKMTLSKMDYVVFETFEGRNFDHYLATKCVILGPMAISICLTENKPIPNFQWPIFSVVLYDCEVTCTQLSHDIKQSLGEKIKLMGGLYTKDFTEGVTHLICGGTKSEKYWLAARQGAKLMLPTWIDYLYTASLSANVNPNDPEILEKYKCKPFHKLTICSTGVVSSSSKKHLEKTVTENGGTYVGKLVISKTDILVCNGPAGTSSDKFKAARKSSHVECVSLDWIYDSVAKGYSLPVENYKVKVATSTPTKEAENIDPNFSMLSTISTIQDPLKVSVVNETHLPKTDTKLRNKRKAEEDLVENLDLKKVKTSSGSCLEGCSILVAGFQSPIRDKLHKIINISGATRYDLFSSRVSHVIVGDSSCSEVALVKSKGADCCLVNVQWLLDSIEQKKPVSEQKYLIDLDSDDGANNTITGSPLSKKVLSFLKDNKPQNENVIQNVRSDLEDVVPEDPLTEKYLSNANSKRESEEDTLAKLLKDGDVNRQFLGETREQEFKIKTLTKSNVVQNESLDFKPNSTSTQVDSMDSNLLDIPPIFTTLTFSLNAFDEETTDELTECIRAAKGTVVNNYHTGSCDYAVYPKVWTVLKKPGVKHVVNDMWVKQCLEDAILISPPEYYHTVFEQPNKAPLLDCVICISNYASYERRFLQSIIESLGGKFQEQFSRKILKEKDTLASTHLVCPSPTGKKFKAAEKWGIPVVNKDWLLACLKSCSLEPVEPYLINPEVSLEENCTLLNPQTPKNHLKDLEPHEVMTPENNYCDEDQGERMSQVTPINKIIQKVMNDNVLQTPSTPTYPWTIKTPDTPLGHFIRADPSPNLRKQMQKYVNSFGDFVPPKRRMSTPLSELKRRLWSKCFGQGENSQPGEPDPEDDLNSNDEVSIAEIKECKENPEVHKKLLELRQRVMASSSSSATRRSSNMFEPSNIPGVEKTTEVPHSQVFSVAWDYEVKKTQDPASKIFMLSAISHEDREKLSNDLKELGANISTLSNYDPEATHLICSKPGRNEKALACMAAGKWILHVSYVIKSKEAGHFLDEEEFEFGNPKAKKNISFEEKDGCIYQWRKEVARRGYGAFHDMRAIVVSEKKDSLANVIEAGGGVVVKVDPPYDDPVHATHCLLEVKLIKNFEPYVPLVKQGIKCLNTLYISHCLMKVNSEDIRDYIVPYFSNYYH